MSATPRHPPETAESSSGLSSSSSYPPVAAAVVPAQHPACSACKHQRRKCAPGCPLAPYFPADKPGSFRNSHRLFGIKNILRILTTAGPENRDDCMKSILYEADARASDPVHGSCGICRSHERELASATAELALVKKQLQLHGHAVQNRSAPDAPGFISPDQPWMTQPPLMYPIQEGQQQAIYGTSVPAAAVKIDEDATIGVKLDEDDVMSMQHDDHAQGRTVVGAHYGRIEPPPSSSCRSSDTSPRGLLNRRAF
ncbi:hypothetical protein ZWY2020_010993 [Hordeum vulgare]|nr:hypothetical protein ZWY2020_010993 [Hordeum vulgare]